MLLAALPWPVLFARISLFEFIADLAAGNVATWIALAAIVGCVAFFAIYQKVTGKSFVKSRKERREARNRRKHVLWEYKRDD